MSRADDRQSEETGDAGRTALRNDLIAAIKARRSETITALRTALAAIDNAESVVATVENAGAPVSGRIAGATTGLGSTEAVRRELSASDVRSILQAEIDDRLSEADRYEHYGHSDAGARLRREAAVLMKYMPALGVRESSDATSDAPEG